ncbi:hypothetical protein GS399_20435 [Pedobacter sp. HMF7647]|uniref:Uncharacterized protein n=1 Tax=Hufsiella arboris TaxID=2695275 RepID=A0A7K1YFF9_9SPHI|nr:hypothetical protein [Hufsiella arboris]MXV53335.1 hypothetical protein [Hufsiella arboris]
MAALTERSCNTRFICLSVQNERNQNAITTNFLNAESAEAGAPDQRQLAMSVCFLPLINETTDISGTAPTADHKLQPLIVCELSDSAGRISLQGWDCVRERASAFEKCSPYCKEIV